MSSARRRVAALAALALLALLPPAGSQPPAGGRAPLPDALRFGGAFTSIWSPAAARQARLDDTNTIPLVLAPPQPIAPDLYVWDFWPLRQKDGSVAVVDGWTVIVALTAPRAGNVPGERHGLARWRYFFRRAGRPWRDGGPVFEGREPIGDRQWAGSTVLDPETGRVTFYYTALGRLPAEPGSPGQRRTASRQVLAAASARVVAGDSGVRFTGWSEHAILLTADGRLYQTAEQRRAGPYIFRDPWYFSDPATGEEFLLFAATSAIRTGPHNGVVGLAVRRGGRWELLPPLLSAKGVNSQLERPHIVVQQGRHHLFFTSHAFSFASGITAPDGLYGFVSNGGLRGHYVPLNGSGLVLGNPREAPLQTYSYIVTPGGAVLSYINYVRLGDVTLSGIGRQSRAWQRRHFGGTPAPVMAIRLAGGRTRLAQAPLDVSDPGSGGAPAGG